MSHQSLQPGQTAPFPADDGTLESYPGGVRKGQPVPPTMLAQARSTPRSVRIVREGDMITMDFLPDRITIVIDAEGRVISSRRG